MSIPSVLAIVVVIGYLVFEVSILHKQRYRMEPLFVHNEFVTANHATQRCGEPDEAERQQFLLNFKVVQRNALADLMEKTPETATVEASAELARLRTERESEVDTFIDSNGCDDKQVWRWVKLHDVRANLSLR